MNNEPSCPQCQAQNTYFDGTLWVCPDCGNEWSEAASTVVAAEADTRIRDAFGTLLADGDSVSVIKNLKVKGTSSVVKVGTKVKNIRLVESDDGHNIACRIEGIGQMNLKSEFVKKA